GGSVSRSADDGVVSTSNEAASYAPTCTSNFTDGAPGETATGAPSSVADAMVLPRGATISSVRIDPPRGRYLPSKCVPRWRRSKSSVASAKCAPGTCGSIRTPSAVASTPAIRSAARSGIACWLLFMTGKSVIGVTGLYQLSPGRSPEGPFNPSGPLQIPYQTDG